MGLFDLFRAGKDKGTSEKAKPSPAAKWANAAGDRRAQNYDRQEALQALAAMGTADAASALLRRFTFLMDPSITDQEEKELAYSGLLRAGREAIEPVRAFAAKAESLAWPMKIMKEILPEDEYVEELLVWLERWDVEYAKFIDPKLQLLVELAEHQHPSIREEAERFLLDVNEPARFHAVAAVLAQKDVASLDPLIETLGDEESVRVRNKIAEGVLLLDWAIPEERRDLTRKSLPSGYTIDGEGKLRKR
jgi:hypothetical protein